MPEQSLGVQPTELSQFFRENTRFEALPPALKTIAIDTAQTVLGYKDQDLLLKAVEIDTIAISDEFAHTEQEGRGGLIENYLINHKELLEKYPFEEVVKIGMRRLRQSIAFRMSRSALAKELGYHQPGEYEKITTNPDFQAANELCWEVVKKFQTRSKLLGEAAPE